jgi:hypothetical protein
MLGANQACTAPAEFIDDGIYVDTVHREQKVHRLARDHRNTENRAVFSPFQPSRVGLWPIHSGFIGNHQWNLYRDCPDT